MLDRDDLYVLYYCWTCLLATSPGYCATAVSVALALNVNVNANHEGCFNFCTLLELRGSGQGDSLAIGAAHSHSQLPFDRGK